VKRLFQVLSALFILQAAVAADPLDPEALSEFLIEPAALAIQNGTASFGLTTVPQTVGPGGATQVIASLLGTPATAPPFLALINPGGELEQLDPNQFKIVSSPLLGSTTTFTLDSVNPVGQHREAIAFFDPQQPYTTGIAAVGAVGGSRGSPAAPRLEPGDPLTILVATAGSGVQLGDIYAAVFLPGATTFFTFTGVNQLSPPNTILPLVRSVPLNNLARVVITANELPADLPRGTYLLAAAIGPPGADILQERFFLAVSQFTFE